MSRAPARKRRAAEAQAAEPAPAPSTVPAPPPPARDPGELLEHIARLRHREPMRLDQALLALGLVDPAQVELARRIKDEDPSLLLGSILEHNGGVSEETVHAGLAYQLGVPAVDLRHWPVERGVLAQLPAVLAHRYRAVPIHQDGNVLYVAMSDVLNRDALDALHLCTPLSVQPVYASLADVELMLDSHYLAGVTAPVSDEDLERETRRYTVEVEDAAPAELAPTDNVIVRLADQIIAEAHRERASDIHIEPRPAHGKTLVRVRIDGRMFVRRAIPWAYRNALVSRYKVMANLNLAEHRIPQDGKILFRRSGVPPIELRVAVLPTAGGVEDVVLRILDTNAALPMSALGLSEHDHGPLRSLIEKPYGILLVCGPTGSGKTTTLHALLHHLNDGSRKIWTVENPVEITQPGLRQVEVNPRAGLTFATALRAFLRADPDVIMVGEIRDAETAKTALEASLTGHLVFSTLHTNNAPESVVRLLEMGMNPYNFSDSLLGILAQRLVRCLCRHCREPFEASDEELLHLAREYGPAGQESGPDPDALVGTWRQTHGRDGAVTLYRPRGCAECVGTGYRARVGVFELLTATSEIKRLIIDGAPAAALFKVALDQGMQSLKQDGVHKVLAGVTDMHQVLAVSQR